MSDFTIRVQDASIGDLIGHLSEALNA